MHKQLQQWWKFQLTIEIITQTRQGKVYRRKLTTERINWSFTNHYLEL